MAVRFTGLASGLDTESIVEQIMEAHKMRKKKVDDKHTKLEWTQDKWKELNTKLYKLYNDQASKMRLQSSYKTKKVSSSNEAKLTATAAASAPTGSNVVTVDKLASAQYVTGADISAKGLKASSKLTDIKDANGNSLIAEGTVFTVKVGEGDSAVTKQFTVKSDSTINDFVTTLKNAGLNANFDEKQGRFFISSVDSGEKNKFTLTSNSLTSDAKDARAAIEEAINYSLLSAEDKTKVDNAYYKLLSGTYKESYDATNSLLDIVEASTRKAVEAGAKDYVKEEQKAVVEADTTLMDEYRTKAESEVKDEDVEKAVKDKYTAAAKAEIEAELDADIAANNIEIQDETHREVLLNERINALLESRVQAKLDDTDAYNADLAATKEEKIQALVDKSVDAKVNEYIASDEGKEKIAGYVESGFGDNAGVAEQVTLARDTLNAAIENYKALGSETEASGTSGALSALGLAEITGSEVKSADGTGMTVIAAQDSQITLNGAILKGTSNTFTANGITFDLKAETKGESIVINVTNDVDATYNMVKDFIKEYNNILKEMNTLYYADSSRGYDPLSDDEKEAMTEDQIDKWETKIKDSLLRRDSNLGSLINSMKSAMSSSVNVNGKSYSLTSFGIMTSTDYKEKGLLHIYGDSEDAVYSSQTDKLKKALEEDPDTVINVLSGVAKNLFDAMQDKMKSTSLSSSMTFYNDKQISKQLTQYKKDMTDWEEKLQDIEDRYYKQFAAMETAMSKLNSQSSYLAGLFGGAQ